MAETYFPKTAPHLRFTMCPSLLCSRTELPQPLALSSEISDLFPPVREKWSGERHGYLDHRDLLRSSNAIISRRVAASLRSADERIRCDSRALAKKPYIPGGLCTLDLPH
jgi:hypothetical protein